MIRTLFYEFIDSVVEFFDCLDIVTFYRVNNAGRQMFLEDDPADRIDR